MRRRHRYSLALLGTLAAVVCCVLVWRQRTVAPRAPTPSRQVTSAQLSGGVNSQNRSQLAPESEERRIAVKTVEAVYAAPIAFYGKVQDQYGESIPAARVEYSAVDKFWEAGTKYTGVSDQNGAFSLTGIKGAALSVAVWKTGYDAIHGQSNGAFSFGMPYDSRRDRPTPTKEHPALFVLRKKAPADPLITVDRDVLVPKDGTPVEVSLKTGKVVGLGNGDIKIECWTSAGGLPRGTHYDWRCSVSVPAGGLLPRTDKNLQFEAPADGYEPTVEFAMSAAADRWRPDHDAEYWVKLRDATYGRMRFRITTAGHHFATITSYVNPSGSRNLEFDAKKQITTR
jgi:hypothetical protein